MPLKQPDVILLDLDNTFYEYLPCHEIALTSAATLAEQILGIEPDVFKLRYDMGRKQVHEILGSNASSHNRLLYFQRLIEIILKGSMVGEALQLYKKYWDAFIDNIVIFDGVIEFLHKARAQGISLVLVTDLTADVQFKKLDRLNLSSLLDAVVTSEEAGCDKPDSAIFKLALEKSGRKTDKVWMIGDSPKKDIKGGNDIGAETLLKIYGTNAVDGSSETTPDHTFEAFNELTEILRGFDSDAGISWESFILYI